MASESYECMTWSPRPESKDVMVAIKATALLGIPVTVWSVRTTGLEHVMRTLNAEGKNATFSAIVSGGKRSYVDAIEAWTDMDLL